MVTVKARQQGDEYDGRANARIRQKAGGSDSPNPQIPRIEIELVTKLLTVLYHGAGPPVSTWSGRPGKKRTKERKEERNGKEKKGYKEKERATCLAVSCWEGRTVIAQIAAVSSLFGMGIHVVAPGVGRGRMSGQAALET